MSDFNYTYMSNDEVECVVFNKDKYTKEQAIKQAKYELDLEDEKEVKLVVFESCIQYGYHTSDDGEKFNGWYIKNIYGPVKRTSNFQVPVGFVRVKEEFE